MPNGQTERCPCVAPPGIRGGKYDGQQKAFQTHGIGRTRFGAVVAKSPQALCSSPAAKLMTVVDSRFENLLVRFGIPKCRLRASLSQDMLRVYKCASEEHR